MYEETEGAQPEGQPLTSQGELEAMLTDVATDLLEAMQGQAVVTISQTMTIDRTFDGTVWGPSAVTKRLIVIEVE